MSVLTTLATDATAHTAALYAAAAPMAAGPGFIDWATNLNNEVKTLVLAVVWTLGILFVVIQGVATRGSMARIILAGIGAGIFIWIAHNVMDVSDSVGNELPGAAPAVEIVHTGPSSGLQLY